MIAFVEEHLGGLILLLAFVVAGVWAFVDRVRCRSCGRFFVRSRTGTTAQRVGPFGSGTLRVEYQCRVCGATDWVRSSGTGDDGDGGDGGD